MSQRWFETIRLLRIYRGLAAAFLRRTEEACERILDILLNQEQTRTNIYNQNILIAMQDDIGQLQAMVEDRTVVIGPDLLIQARRLAREASDWLCEMDQVLPDFDEFFRDNSESPFHLDPLWEEYSPSFVPMLRALDDNMLKLHCTNSDSAPSGSSTSGDSDSAVISTPPLLPEGIFNDGQVLYNSPAQIPSVELPAEREQVFGSDFYLWLRSVALSGFSFETSQEDLLSGLLALDPQDSEITPDIIVNMLHRHVSPNHQLVFDAFAEEFLRRRAEHRSPRRSLPPLVDNDHYIDHHTHVVMPVPMPGYMVHPSPIRLQQVEVVVPVDERATSFVRHIVTPFNDATLNLLNQISPPRMYESRKDTADSTKAERGLSSDELRIRLGEILWNQ